MIGSRGLLMVLLLSASAVASTDATVSKPAPIDETGTTHVPAFDIPLSSYMSEPAKQAFIKAATAAQSSDANWKSLSISKIRALGESELQKYVDRARSLYPVTIEERKPGGSFHESGYPTGRSGGTESRSGAHQCAWWRLFQRCRQRGLD
jgi:hypothetical protein